MPYSPRCFISSLSSLELHQSKYKKGISDVILKISDIGF